MRKCKYCGRILRENERCTCPKAIAMRRKLFWMSIVAGVVIAVVIVVAIIIGADSSPSDSSHETHANTDTVTSESSTTADSDAEQTDAVTTSVENLDETKTDETDLDESVTEKPVVLVDLFEYYIKAPTFDKYNGAGVASVATDAERLLAALIGEKPSVEEVDAYLAYLDIRDDYYYAIRSIDVAITPNENLRNGDEITVTVTVPEFLADKVTNASKTYVVSGIPEIQRVDILSMFHFGFNNNISGEADITVAPITEDNYLFPGSLHVEPRYNLSSGDSVTVTISDDYVEYLINQHNIIPTETEKTITVPPLAEYIMSAEQLPKDTLAEIAQRFAEEEQASLVEDLFTYGDVHIYGYYLMNRKPEGYASHRNIVEIMVSYDAYLRDEYSRTYYVPIRFYNVIQDPDGTVSIPYESGDSSTFTTDITTYFSNYESNYTVTQIEIAE